VGTAALAGSNQTVRFGDRSVKLFVDMKRGLFISDSCRKSEDFDCDASRALKLASFKKVSGALEGGANPGAMICLSLGGKLLSTLEADKSSTSYCEFKDGSVAASGTLTYYGRKNDAH
jgi:putative hemolysin